jgi:hypothetical protein
MTCNQSAVRSTRVPVVVCMLAGLLGASPVFAADLAADVVGSWRKVSHTVTFGGTTADTHAALRMTWVGTDGQGTLVFQR